MYVAEMIFNQISKPEKGIDVDDILYSVLGSLYLNGQIARDYFISQQTDSYIAHVMVPEKISLQNKYNNSHVLNRYEKLAKAGLSKPETKIRGFEISSKKACECAFSQTFVLYTNYTMVESPVVCGDCFRPVPLYHLPKTYDDEYYDVLGWQVDYKSCDRLQMNCMTGEKFGIREMSICNSSLSRRGRSICREIEKGTGIPTYYYLYHPNGISYKMERQRKCPSCEGEWLLEMRVHGLFDFCCAECRLLSNIAWDTRY